MSAEKAELARAGTMQVTAKEGKAFLDKNLTEWKKPYLMDDEDEEEDDEVEHDSSPVKKAKLSKHSTMKGTAKEAAGYLEAHGKPDQDALTRGQQKKIEQLQNEKSTPKKGRVVRDNTMASTAKEGRALVGDKLGDTRADTKKSKKGKVGRSSTMAQVAEEAKLLYGDMPASEGRSLRKRSAPPPAKVPAKKKAVSKAKEGGTGKRGRPKKIVEKKEDKKEEANNKESEEEEKDDEEEEDEN